MDLTHHFRNELKIHFYASHGEPVLTKTFNGGSLFGFSQSGNKFAVGTGKNFFVISVPDKQVETFPAADQFDFSENEKLLALARGGAIRVYADSELLHVFNTGFIYPRKVRISTTNQFVAVIDKLHLKVFSLKTKQLLFEKKLTGKKSFRDLFISKGKILAGVQHREKGVSTGIIKMYDLRGKLIETKQGKRKKFKTFPSLKKTPKSSGTYEIIPWMFFPFDSMRTVWNYYEQHMGYGAPEDSYLHQGLDLIVPINEPVYAVTGGIVKCVLSLTGGAAYWRIATSDTQTAGYSQGWLYAHLIQSTIQFDVGDTVHIHDYLGNIIQWDQDWGHIHFVMIEDSGLVWRYDDNEWGIVYNPLLSLRPYEDLTPPIFFDVFENQKFAFCANETSNYLDPDSLYGNIDIIVKIKDFIGDSPWVQPAFETFYWVKKLPEDTVVFPHTLGQRLNHKFNFYSYGNFVPYPDLIYKRDNLLTPTSWMIQDRNFYHILTNNNGDSLIDLSEKYLAFPTTDYVDGDYRIFVEAKDEFGNSTTDSMNVKFRNGITQVPTVDELRPVKFQLRQNFPNPFNPQTKISFNLPEADNVSLKIYNIRGELVTVLVDELLTPGSYSFFWRPVNEAGGIYFYTLETGTNCCTKKMLFLR